MKPLTLAVAFLCSFLNFAQPAVRGLDATDLAEVALALPMGGDLQIKDVQLDPFSPPQTMVLERFAVFSPDAEIIVHGANGDSRFPIPKNAYFYGKVAGNDHARVYLSVLESGQIRGLISDRGRFWLAAGGEGSGGPLQGMALLELDAADLEHVSQQQQCETDLLTGERLPLAIEVPPATPAASSSSYTMATYNARIAIESDVEYFQKFGNTMDATNYTADLIAYASTLYSDELDTSLTISHVSLWSGGTDPWSQFGTTCGLFEFGRYWNDNNTAIDRTIAHFLSGKNNGGGVAWVGALCNNPFNYDHDGNCPSLTPQTDNYGGDYGYSGDLDANFNINNPAAVWDIVVVSHEMGHNFNSPHSHCYQNIGGNSSAVDSCYSGQCGQGGCYCGATSLPCAAGPGNGCGTIMSYCHLLSGNLSNISLTLGTGHPHGVAPERVPNRMEAAVVSANQSQPNCLPLNSTLSDFFSDWPEVVSILDLVPLVSP